MNKITFNELDNQIIDFAVSKKQNILINGAGGVGKSTLINEISIQIQDQNSKNYRTLAITALTGVAAVLIKGTTLHRFAGIGLATEEPSKIQVFRWDRLPTRRYRPRQSFCSCLCIPEIITRAKRYPGSIGTGLQHR